MKNNLWHHQRFYFAAAFGGVIGIAALAWTKEWQMQALQGVNGFFLMYLGLSARLAASTKPEELKRQAAADDEGIVLIVLMAIGAVLISLIAIIWVISGKDRTVWQSVSAFSAVPLGWGTAHTLAAFRYARLYYAAKPEGGLTFPGTKMPDVWDFIYFSFVIGMTAQVSDVVVTGPHIRKTVLTQSIGAFFYNTIILAFAVNAAVALGS